MQELITAYEEKIAAMQLVIDGQNKMIAKLHNFLTDVTKELYPIVDNNVKKQASLSVLIEQLKTKSINQTVEISDQDASDLGIAPDSEEDDFVVAPDSEEDDFVVAPDSEEDDFVVAPDSEEDDFVVAPDSEEDDFVVAPDSEEDDFVVAD